MARDIKEFEEALVDAIIDACVAKADADANYRDMGRKAGQSEAKAKASYDRVVSLYTQASASAAWCEVDNVNGQLAKVKAESESAVRRLARLEGILRRVLPLMPQEGAGEIALALLDIERP